MTDTETLPAPYEVDTDLPPTKHLARMDERRFDHTVETLCGLIRSVKPPRPGAARCQTCQEIYDGIAALDAL